MSAIPPNPIVSGIGAGPAQAQQAREQDAVKNADKDRASALVAGPDAIVEVESTDTDDTQVHTDSGGLGSQGRYDAAPEGPEQQEEAAESTDDDAPPHLDVRA